MFGIMNSGAYKIKDCSVDAILTNEDCDYCGGFAGEIMQDATGVFDNCGFNGSYKYYNRNNNLAFGIDWSEMEFTNCWYSQEAYDNSNGSDGRSENPSKNYDIQLKN